MGSSFECVGVARELTLVKFFLQISGNKAILLGRLDSGQIVNFLGQQKVGPRNYNFLFIF